MYYLIAAFIQEWNAIAVQALKTKSFFFKNVKISLSK